MIIRFDISLEEFNFIDALISIITILLATHSNITEHQAELDKSCNLPVLPVMNEILFRKKFLEIFFPGFRLAIIFSVVAAAWLHHEVPQRIEPSYHRNMKQRRQHQYLDGTELRECNCTGWIISNFLQNIFPSTTQLLT